MTLPWRSNSSILLNIKQCGNPFRIDSNDVAKQVSATDYRKIVRHEGMFTFLAMSHM